MRLSASLTVVGALLLMSGVLMALVGEAMRLNSPRDGQAFVRAGEILAAAGLACGLAVMLAVAVGATRRRPAGLRAARRGRAAQSGRASKRGGFAQVVQAAAERGGFAQEKQPAAWGGFAQGEPAAAEWVGFGQAEQAGAESGGFAQVEQAAAGWGDFASVTSQWPVGRLEQVTPPRGDHAAVEEWLSQFRPVHAASAAEPEPEPEPEPWLEHVQERRVSSAYTDDGWQPEEIPADSATRWPEPAFAQDAAVVDLRFRREALSLFDPAPDPRRDYLAQSAPASGLEIPRVSGGGLHARELSDPLAVDDDPLAVDDTVPLPVIAADISPASVSSAPVSPASVSPASVSSASVPPASVSSASAWFTPGLAPPTPVPAPARAKLDQLKDLYLTAEAIGEDALGRHFDEVSERQRQLIREYFNQAGVGPGGVPGTTSDQTTNAALPLFP